MLAVEKYMSLRRRLQRCAQPCRIRALLLKIAFRTLKDRVEISLYSLCGVISGRQERVEFLPDERPIDRWGEVLERRAPLR